ncbi:flavin reductase family protein [Roseivirga sp. BDSF3-8]|uniref:flavin reductase family protein n=1 Tax=Roseivirga sp. BDSF3-8 TaxID=3241598 RepID=UPI003532641D
MNESSIHYTGKDIEGMEKFFRRNLINCLSGFKSVNLIGTISENRETNLSVFSQVIHVGATPPLMGILFRPHSVPRHTLENILSTEVFTINHIHPGIFKQAHQTSARYQVSEFDSTGLTPLYTGQISAPYVKESFLRIGLRFQEKYILMNDTVLIVGKVEELTIPPKIIQEDGFIDLEAIKTITCSGLDKYHTTSSLARLSYPKPAKPLSEIQ